jgi:hypothetical protein
MLGMVKWKSKSTEDKKRNCNGQVSEETRESGKLVYDYSFFESWRILFCNCM